LLATLYFQSVKELSVLIPQLIGAAKIHHLFNPQTFSKVFFVFFSSACCCQFHPKKNNEWSHDLSELLPRNIHP
jgi:hypothetical protein